MVGRELGRRLAVAAVGIPLTLVVIFLGGWVLAGVMGVVAALMAREFYRIGRARDVDAFTWIGIPASGALVLMGGAHSSFSHAAPWAMALLMSTLLLSFAAAVWLRGSDGRPMAAVGTTVAGTLYGGGALSFAVFLRHLPDAGGAGGGDLPLQGTALLAFPLAVTWVGDSAAYLLGRRYGRRKLIPSVSPGKTVEGGVASLVASILTGGGLGWFLLQLHPEPLLSALLGGGVGLALAVGAQVGDLAESVMKREAGVKDSGSLLPGHGGAMDRFDALVFNLPLTYALVSLIGFLS